MLAVTKLQNGEKLTLTNGGELSLFFIGVGSAFSKIHNQTNVLAIKGSDHVLIDCGTLCPKALWNYGCPIVNIDNVIITHSHADHIGGVEELALMSRYVAKKKPNLYIPAEYKSAFWNYSLKGGLSFGELKDGENLTIEDIFEVRQTAKMPDAPRTMFEAQIGGLNIKLFRTMHIPDSANSWRDSFYSYGVIFDESILFTSDTRFDREIVEVIGAKYNIKYYFHDCQLFTGGVHSSIEELKSFPPDVKKRTYLSHYGDNFGNFTPEKDGFAGFALEGHFYSVF
ncbi:MAG TPA: MBL fold metallo-hydrolase [Spirochaetota bacterium]|jgi:ribonuclease BN (tRNA processing enzyme)|nr:MAG: ribonuclease Z [Spirochaetes bacterium ADurb.Bin133]HOF00023.1 MBL fold metallo-hydrolase [Spirochaetota bacterium]HOS32022.1 MBL fold metallo-hydrolase [Spirochaetota bacterium]HOS55006.1 MBL fold metallo-hydrolase [Spirochaetota bacterium]HPK61298.1 MBL fold metallo-hydrolase [Spirochaetota bacterium]